MARAKTEPARKPSNPRTKPVIDPADPAEVNDLLQAVADVCKEMRDHEDAVVVLGKRRRQLVTRLRDKKITWNKIAWWANTTDQALYKHHNRNG